MVAPATLSFPFLAGAAEARPEVALVLGSGFSGLSRRVEGAHSVPFVEVPGLAAPTVDQHAGLITLGSWGGKRVLVFEGRLHYYEGHAWRRIEMSARIAAELGTRVLFLTNASGGIRDDLDAGSLMVIRDHIEWTRPYCWRHPGPGSLGRRRPSPYSPRLLELLLDCGRDCTIPISQGIYAAVTGPNYETPAEVRALRTWGADAVGMSTTREATRGARCGLECVALSCVTNRAAGLGPKPIHHEDVRTTAAARAESIAALIEMFLRRL